MLRVTRQGGRCSPQPWGLIARNAEDTSQVVEEGKTISISPGCRDTIAVECGGTPLPGFPWQ